VIKDGETGKGGRAAMTARASLTKPNVAPPQLALSIQLCKLPRPFSQIVPEG
jgi:hypothetical protein